MGSNKCHIFWVLGSTEYQIEDHTPLLALRAETNVEASPPKAFRSHRSPQLR